MKASYRSADSLPLDHVPQNQPPAHKYGLKRAARKHKISGSREIVPAGPCPRSDAEISQTAPDAIPWDTSAPIGHIDVSVKNGRLRLQGRVQWIYQKQRIQFTLERLAGITAIDNQITVTSGTTPREVESTIMHAFQQCPEMDQEKIRVVIKGQKLIFMGTVPSWVEYDWALQAAWSVSGVADVESRIIVTARD